MGGQIDLVVWHNAGLLGEALWLGCLVHIYIDDCLTVSGWKKQRSWRKN